MHRAPSGKTPWLEEIEDEKKRGDTNSEDDQLALDDKLESLLVVKLVEFGWLEKRRREFSIALDIRKILPTLNMRNILVMLREMKDNCTRVKIQV